MSAPRASIVIGQVSIEVIYCVCVCVCVCVCECARARACNMKQKRISPFSISLKIFEISKEMSLQAHNSEAFC